MGIISGAIIGGVAGLIAEKVMKEDHGILTNILIGALGGIVGSWLFSLIGISVDGGWIGSIIMATAGACLIIWIYRQIRKKEGVPEEFHPVQRNHSNDVREDD